MCRWRVSQAICSLLEFTQVRVRGKAALTLWQCCQCCIIVCVCVFLSFAPRGLGLAHTDTPRQATKASLTCRSMSLSLQQNVSLWARTKKTHTHTQTRRPPGAPLKSARNLQTCRRLNRSSTGWSGVRRLSLTAGCQVCASFRCIVARVEVWKKDILKSRYGAAAWVELQKCVTVCAICFASALNLALCFLIENPWWYHSHVLALISLITLNSGAGSAWKQRFCVSSEKI